VEHRETGGAVATDEAVTKCGRCSTPILDLELVMREDGAWYHVRCWRIFGTGEKIDHARDVTRRTRELVEQTRQRLEDAQRAIDDAANAPAVLCVTCRTGIASPEELTMTPLGAMHARCGEPRGAPST
jgi:hypothetical protein